MEKLFKKLGITKMCFESEEKRRLFEDLELKDFSYMKYSQNEEIRDGKIEYIIEFFL
ncbi:MAG: hypothetical protein JW924_12360 [Fusobacteriaceae bacterium]|nr:hypothetical protein [Fusobacteriaceae bacterium]